MHFLHSFNTKVNIISAHGSIDKRDGGGGAAAVDFLKIHRGSGRIFLRTLKKCMNLIEFQCLQVKQPETK